MDLINIEEEINNNSKWFNAAGNADIIESVVIRNNMRKENKFCDLTLKVNDEDLFHVHKIIIASSCSYFNSILNGEWKETKENVISLDYKIIPECFEILLEYLYTRKLGITMISLEYAKIIHESALFFSLPTLKKMMSEILKKFITNDNLLEMWRFGVKNLDDDLRDKCIEKISKYILFFTEKLQELTFEELKSLYENDKFTCLETDKYKSLIKWIKADFELREQHLKVLLNLIDFSNISVEFMQSNILNDKMLYKNVDFVEKVMMELSNCDINKFKIRNVTGNVFEKMNILLISNKGIFKIDLEERKCSTLLRHNINRQGFAVNKLGSNNILISGGENSNICELYCPELNVITPFPPMLENRWSHKVIAFNNKIYAFGGFENATMEIFDLNTVLWNYGPKIEKECCDFSLTEYGGLFHILNRYSTTVTQFDIKTECFKDIKTDIKFGYSNVITSVSVENIIHCFTDRSYKTYKITDLRYNIGSSKPYPNFRLSSCAAIQFQDKIFVFGQLSSTGKYVTALIDIKTKELTKIKMDLSECGDIGDELHLISTNK